ncbi:helix-turn-helix transcriptional regulator [Agrobacterium rhizogenes]|nr:helix-turn-helix transcriptional regulator [Rhizobium rhizogenes]NTI99240.1 helix-turn-helix transcriptional regulator [Rhizobium rhizogenes]
MSNVSRIHSNKTPQRIHYIPEWAEMRHLKQVNIVEELNVDKGLVSKWFRGTLPKPEYLEKLAALFGTDVQGLFREPHDDWLAKFFRDKTEEQKDRAISMLKLFFDQHEDGTGTDGK